MRVGGTDLWSNNDVIFDTSDFQKHAEDLFRQENQTTVKIAAFAGAADRKVRSNESTCGGKLTLPTVNLPARRSRHGAGLNTSRHMALSDGGKSQ
jgi:hypothetical protein